MKAPSDPARMFRGAVCGAVAAAIWALQQPLDKRLFGCSYDDVELLGRAVTRGRDWYPIGFAMHLQNGALFGALYAAFAPALPAPPMARGPLVSVGEHLAFWPLTVLCDRLHPARRRLPRLTGSGRAFAQGAWRHLLFGVVLGELERRINASPPAPAIEPEADFSSNGHGDVAHATLTAPPPA